MLIQFKYWPCGFKTFVHAQMSKEFELFIKNKLLKIKIFFLLSNSLMLINVKLVTFVGILTFISMVKKFILS